MTQLENFDTTSRRALIEKYVEAYNNFDVPAMLAVLTDDVIFENYSAGSENSVLKINLIRDES